MGADGVFYWTERSKMPTNDHIGGAQVTGQGMAARKDQLMLGCLYGMNLASADVC